MQKNKKMSYSRMEQEGEMRKIKLWVETGYVNANHEVIIEVEDDITDEELDEDAKEYMLDRISYGWYEMEE